MKENRRFYISQDCICGDKVILSNGEYNHAVNVLRAEIGDEVVINTGDGNDMFCVITNIQKGFVELKCKRTEKNVCEPNLKLTLFQALPKGDKVEFIVQKAVELGVSKIVPFTSRYTVAKGNQSKTERLNKISVEACKQCGRAVKVEVAETASIQNIVQSFSNFDAVIFCFEGETENNVQDVLKEIRVNKSLLNIALVIGSEGGFSKEEADELIEAGAKVVSLGRRVLRCETASVAAVAIIMYEYGEMVV